MPCISDERVAPFVIAFTTGEVSAPLVFCCFVGVVGRTSREEPFRSGRFEV